MMKKLAAVLVLATCVSASAQNSASLGQGSFAIAEAFTTIPTNNYSQTPTALVLNGGFSLGADTLGGLFSSSYNWTNAPGFGLTMSVTGSNPALNFFVELFNTNVGLVSKYEGSTFGVGSTPTVVEMEFVSFEPGRGQDDLSSVDGLQFTWGSAGTINATIEDITVVPEPTTWALLGVASAVFGLVALRRSSAVARR